MTEAKKRISVTIVLDVQKRKALRQLALDRDTTVQELVSSSIDSLLANSPQVEKAVVVEQEKKPRASKPNKPRKARATVTKTTKPTRARKSKEKKSEAD